MIAFYFRYKLELLIFYYIRILRNDDTSLNSKLIFSICIAHVSTLDLPRIEQLHDVLYLASHDIHYDNLCIRPIYYNSSVNLFGFLYNSFYTVGIT